MRPPERVNDRAYFPASAELLRDCNEQWNATCFVPDSFRNVRIELFPVLADPTRCKAIANAEMSDRCRQLNTFRAAFNHVDSFAELRLAKKMCGDVGPTQISQDCLGRLHNYVRPMNPKTPIRPSLDREYESAESVLIPAPVPGLQTSGSPARLSVDPFEETGTYHVDYSPPRGAFPRNLNFSVLVNMAPTEAQQALVFTSHFAPEKAVSKSELARKLFLGNVITMQEYSFATSVGWAGGSRERFDRYYIAAWVSGSKTVVIRATYADVIDPSVSSEEAAKDRAATAELRNELIPCVPAEISKFKVTLRML